METSNVLDSVLEVFSKVGDWFGESIEGIVPMFYNADTGLTFIGVMTVAGLGFSVILLVLNLIKGYLRFQ